jgi:glycerophosphoryl diester phosphodiesterase
VTVSPIRVPRDFRIIAHRGASGYAPENTMASFRLAESMGAEEIEFDLQMTKDGHMVVVHDPVLDRYGHQGVRVAETTLRDLKRLDMAAWFGEARYCGERMPAAAELFETFGRRFVYHAEIKAPSRMLAERLADELARYGLSDTAVVTSFDFDILVTFRGLSPEQPVGWLVRDGGFTAANVERAASAGFHQFCPHAAEVTPDRVAAAKRRIAEVRAHGVKTRADAESVVRAGCDGMTINWLDWLSR